MCGHELSKRWYSDLKRCIEMYSDDINEIQGIIKDIDIYLTLPRLEEGKQRLKNRLYQIIEKDKERINEEKKNLRDFTEALKNLPERERQVAELHFIDGMKAAEIAEKLFYSERMIYNIQHDSEKKIIDYTGKKEYNTHGSKF